MIRINPVLCSGCRRCETTCTFFHSGNTGRHNARIRVSHLYQTGIDTAVVCQQCSERYCLKCPQKALSIGSGGEIVCSPTLCILCGRCEQECPIGAIEIVQDIVYVCDLCGGKPRCVEACTEKAIWHDPAKQSTISLEGMKEKSAKLSAPEKRAIFAVELGRALRKVWEKKNG